MALNDARHSIANSPSRRRRQAGQIWSQLSTLRRPVSELTGIGNLMCGRGGGGGRGGRGGGGGGGDLYGNSHARGWRRVDSDFDSLSLVNNVIRLEEIVAK